MNHTTKTLFIQRTAPYGAFKSREGLDTLLTLATFGQTITVLFMDDGVLQLQQQQHPDLAQGKALSNMLEALPLYEVTELYAVSEAMTSRNICSEQCVLPVQWISTHEVTALIQQHHSVLTS